MKKITILEGLDLIVADLIRNNALPRIIAQWQAHLRLLAKSIAKPVNEITRRDLLRHFSLMTVNAAAKNYHLQFVRKAFARWTPDYWPAHKPNPAASIPLATMVPLSRTALAQWVTSIWVSELGPAAVGASIRSVARHYLPKQAQLSVWASDVIIEIRAHALNGEIMPEKAAVAAACTYLLRGRHDENPEGYHDARGFWHPAGRDAEVYSATHPSSELPLARIEYRSLRHCVALHGAEKNATCACVRILTSRAVASRLTVFGWMPEETAARVMREFVAT